MHNCGAKNLKAYLNYGTTFQQEVEKRTLNLTHLLNSFPFKLKQICLHRLLHRFNQAAVQYVLHLICISGRNTIEPRIHWWSKEGMMKQSQSGPPSDHQQRPVPSYREVQRLRTKHCSSCMDVILKWRHQNVLMIGPRVSMCERLARGLRNRSVESIVLSQKQAVWSEQTCLSI